MKDYITIIGGGLAGSEAAYQIAKRGIKVKLYEMKPQKFSPAHTNKNLAEVVCSNSFKSNLHTNACGLLKEELRILDSLLIKIADETSVPAGQALAVDREVFSKRVTEELEKMENIEIIRKEIGNEAITDKNELENMASDGIVIIATGPLTSDNLSNEILKITGQDKLFFYDAAAPIIEKDSIDMNIAFWGERYEQEREKEEDIEKWTERIKTQNEASYLNLPMNKEEYEKALAWTREHCKEGRDDNPDFVKFNREQKDKQWEFTIKMYCIIKDLIKGNPNLPEQFKEEMVGHNAICAGFQGQRQWTDHWPNCDYPEAILNSSFDFEGKKEPIVLATENDVLNGLGMLFCKLLTNRAQIFADVRTFWSPEATKRVTGYDLEGRAKENGGLIHLLNSGAACLDACGECTDENGNAVMKKWWDVTDEDIKKMTDATVWCEAGFDNFRGGGFSSHFTTRAEMPVTMIRLNLVKGLGPMLQIAEGWTVKLPDEVSDTLMERTNPTWPCTWFTPRCDGKEGSAFKSAYDVMNHWGANHGAISYGHIGADLITLCSMLRIPVSMHNVPEDKIFRPTAWNAFGTKDLEGADYRACAAYGPLYK